VDDSMRAGGRKHKFGADASRPSSNVAPTLFSLPCSPAFSVLSFPSIFLATGNQQQQPQPVPQLCTRADQPYQPPTRRPSRRAQRNHGVAVPCAAAGPAGSGGADEQQGGRARAGARDTGHAAGDRARAAGHDQGTGASVRWLRWGGGACAAAVTATADQLSTSLSCRRWPRKRWARLKRGCSQPSASRYSVRGGWLRCAASAGAATTAVWVGWCAAPSTLSLP
jgi:hypothetical protein